MIKEVEYDEVNNYKNTFGYLIKEFEINLLYSSLIRSHTAKGAINDFDIIRDKSDAEFHGRPVENISFKIGDIVVVYYYDIS